MKEKWLLLGVCLFLGGVGQKWPGVVKYFGKSGVEQKGTCKKKPPEQKYLKKKCCQKLGPPLI
jgi:hypothetical protein